MPKYALIAVGYRRPAGLKRLLESLRRADCAGARVTLIVSVDGGGDPAVGAVAREFDWPHGEKRLCLREARLGLRAHLLSLGDWLAEFDAAAVFEDDVIAMPGFYRFMAQAVPRYAGDSRIAGISLYSPRWNGQAFHDFTPAPSAHDAYFMRQAQSWGQIWMRRAWTEFRAWYDAHAEDDLSGMLLPDFVKRWPDTSWLKYHTAYCAACEKDFVYPYASLTSCFAEAGTHSPFRHSLHHPPLWEAVPDALRLPDPSEGVRYDAFFERRGLARALNLPEDELCVSLYGTKPLAMRSGGPGRGEAERFRYLLTTERLPFAALRGFALELRPHEQNVLQENPGADILLYDLARPAPPPSGDAELLRFRYHERIGLQNRRMLGALLENLRGRLRGR